MSVGNSGLEVSRVAPGLDPRDRRDGQGAERLIHRAAGHGVAPFDRADIHGPGDDRASGGESEKILGRAWKGKRADPAISSKSASSCHVVRGAERSPTRLDADRVGVCLPHVYDAGAPADE